MSGTVPHVPRPLSQCQPPLHSTTFEALLEELERPRQAIEAVMKRGLRIGMFGSVCAGLNDDESDLDVICVYENFDNTGKDNALLRTGLLHTGFGILLTYLLEMQACSKVKPVYWKWTIEFKFQGIKVDLYIDTSKFQLHSHVALSRCIKACVTENCEHLSVDTWKALLQSARDSEVAQRRGSIRGTKVKTVVVSLLVAAALQNLSSQDWPLASDVSLSELAAVLCKFVSTLRYHRLCMMSESNCSETARISFYLQPKPDADERLVLINQLDMDKFSGGDCIHAECTVTVSQLETLLESLCSRT